MKVFGLIIVLSLIWGGYTSAAHAFGLVSSCDKSKMASMRMMDCCDHDQGKPVHPNCLKCDCCSAAVMTPAILAAMTVPVPPPLAKPVASRLETLAADAVYLQLRPPNLLL